MFGPKRYEVSGQLVCYVTRDFCDLYVQCRLCYEAEKLQKIIMEWAGSLGVGDKQYMYNFSGEAT
jgi:hypothetical protein